MFIRSDFASEAEGGRSIKRARCRKQKDGPVLGTCYIRAAQHRCIVDSDQYKIFYRVGSDAILNQLKKLRIVYIISEKNV